MTTKRTSAAYIPLAVSDNKSLLPLIGFGNVTAYRYSKSDTSISPPPPVKSTTKAEAAVCDFIKQQPRYKSRKAITGLQFAGALPASVKQLSGCVTKNRTERRKEPERHP